VAKFKHLGMRAANQNYIPEKIKSRVNSGSAYYRSSSHPLSKNLKNEIYETTVLPVVLYGCEAYSFVLRQENRLWIFEKRELRRIFRRERKKSRRIEKIAR
jgi:hypothetical protein